MSFTRQQKKINQQYIFNPPPGYYQSQTSGAKQICSFGRQGRFGKSQIKNVPGPGSYNNNMKDAVRKRLIDESQRREIKAAQASGSSNIKISSIPSIPKKSATRVYEQLAPGILILHEQQYDNTSVGPGSYNITDKLTHPKQIAHRIPPEHKKKLIEDESVEVNVPTIAEQIRNQKRLMYKQNVIKSSTINKSEISPSDLCLEVIILREKLLRSDDNPPPGYYHNQNQSAFKIAEEHKPADAQCLGGKEKRFQDIANKPMDIGPASYKTDSQIAYKGGFIPKSQKLSSLSEDKPGPGAYISQKPKAKQQGKGNYPPIFGSGCNRFPSAPKAIVSTEPPGPGSYQIDKKRNKKQKYIKIKKQLFQPTKMEQNSEPSFGINSDFPQISQINHNSQIQSVKQRRFYQVQKNSSNFASKVERFAADRTVQEMLGPGNYEIINQEFSTKTFNKRQEGYVGSRGARFDEYHIRPKIGPGTYNPAYETVKQKKIINVFM